MEYICPWDTTWLYDYDTPTISGYAPMDDFGNLHYAGVTYFYALNH